MELMELSESESGGMSLPDLTSSEGEASLGEMVLSSCGSSNEAASSEEAPLGEMVLPSDVSSDEAASGGRALLPVPPFGRALAGDVVPVPVPTLKAAQPLDIALLAPFRPRGVTSRSAPLRVSWTCAYYGTLRRFPATHLSCGYLSNRNKHELPQCLYYSAEFQREHCRRNQEAIPMVVSPRFAEWLMGLPAGWTSTSPLSPAVLHAHVVKRQPQVAHKHRVLSLFSGCGALDFSQLGWFSPVAYCEICPEARQVLQARMSDGSLPRGPVFTDVRDVTLESLRSTLGDIGGGSGVFASSLPAAVEPGVLAGSPRRIVGLVFGFPCVDLSRAGSQRGIAGPASGLVEHALRLALDLEVEFLFAENVDNIRVLPSGANILIKQICEKGFFCKWVSLTAAHAGSPQRRKRWFLFASRQVGFRFAPPADDALWGMIRGASGLSFNSGRPPVGEWMCPKSAYPSLKARLGMLGDAVVPLQGVVAARLLAAM